MQDWSSINDLGVLEKVFSTTFFQFDLIPVQPNLENYRNVLVLSPHQDDESIGAGGLLLKLAAKGANLHVLYTTDGAQNNLGISVAESVELRNKEAKKALSYIGASFHQMKVSNIRPTISLENVKELSAYIHRLNPDLILVPWFLDTPVKHRLANHMLYLAHRRKPWKGDCEIWGYEVHNHLYPNIAIDITKEIDRKTEMITCFESQNQSFKDYPHITKGLNAYNSKFLKGADLAELYFGLPHEEYLGLVEKFFLTNKEQIYRGDDQYVRNMKELEKEIVTA